MTYKHSFVDDYPYLAYSSSPEAVQPNAGDIADLKSADAALDARLDLIEANGWVTTDRIAAKAVTTAKIADAATPIFTRGKSWLPISPMMDLMPL